MRREKQESSKEGNSRSFSGGAKWRAVLLHVLLLLAVFCLSRLAQAAVVEADPELHRVMGDLYVLSAAMQLYRDDARAVQCPVPSELEGYLTKPLPSAWAENYRTAEANGDWWVGRRVPEFSSARKFLRVNAEKFGLYERENEDGARLWLGDSFVWVKAVSPVKTVKMKRAAQTDEETLQAAEGQDPRRLFFNVPGTEEYWWSDLLFTEKAREEVLKKFKGTEGPLAIPLAPKEAEEEFSASPVKLPPEYNLGKSEDGPHVEVGDVIFKVSPR
ncbi:MAG: hypothetical protein LBC93_01130 [Synergistaceae bacterium]|jgi:hypothetical protein|nr:hypothetical protein [Synergistaceae bacterium]